MAQTNIRLLQLQEAWLGPRLPEAHDTCELPFALLSCKDLQSALPRFDLFFPTAAQLPEYLLQTNFENPQGKSAFEFTYQTGLWEHLGENPDLQRDCGAYMRGRRAGQLRWLDVYPVEAELAGKTTDDSVLLVDIGGNQGHDLEMFKERYPKVPGRLILQDLPEAIDRISPSLEGIEVIPYDFFTPQPIEGMFYLVSHSGTIMSNSLSRCTTILLPWHLPRLVRRAMPKAPIQHG